MDLVVGMGQYAVTNKEDDIMQTFALASCVAVTAYCPIRHVAGMIHVVLPYPLDVRDRTERPGYFAQTGVPLLISTLCNRYGCKKENLTIQMFGGAESSLPQDIFNVGRKNIEAVMSALNELGLPVHKADLRGNESRTISMNVRTGAIAISRQPICR